MGKREDFRKVKELIDKGQKLEAMKILLPYRDDERVQATLARLRTEIEIEESGTPLQPAKVSRPVRAVFRIEDVVLHVGAVIVLVWGLMTLLSGLQVPNSYSLRGASAVQITQVYSEAIFLMAQATALFTLAVVLEVAALVIKVKRQ